MRLHTRPTVVTASLAAALVTLAGCGGESDGTDTNTSASSSSSSSTTPNSSTTSTTDSNPDGATAIKVVKNYEKTSAQLRLKPTKETGALGAYATGQAYKQRTFNIRDDREKGRTYEGSLVIVEATASKKSSTRQRVVACTDLTAVTIKEADGQEIPVKHDRLEHIYTVDKSDGEGQDGKWRVVSESVEGPC
ncbi:hypothetical protein [Janibacter anophelis]|uniref:hypothetical protein n=1 Tax=Janibacter anophelis TaxID=319054 RepID=UPI00083668E9|nr:hypothetical protein [Janibacter anophelis]